MATAGLRGARFPPTVLSANRPTSTGAGLRACGASSRDGAAIHSRSGLEGSSPRRADSRVMVRRRPSACSVSRESLPLACTTRPLRPGSRSEPDLEPISSRYCGVCGQPLEPGATVCSNCGAAVEPTAETAAMAPTSEPTPAEGEPTVAMTGAAGAAAGGAAGAGGGDGPPPGADDDGMTPAQRWLVAAAIVLVPVL